jgi:SAM-dependent methyltransferase
MTQGHKVPVYFDSVIEGFRHGGIGRRVHLGHWDQPPETGDDAAVPPGEFDRAQERLDEIVIAMAGLADAQRVLDVGCGLGGTLQAIDRNFAAMTLTGANIDFRQLDICRELEPRDRNRFEWVEADACALPFPAAAFDRVLCIEAMFHFASRRGFFAEAARVLRPGGMLVISDITLAASARQADIPATEIETALLQGYGPWPDLWNIDADHGALAAAAGLTCGDVQDATECTRPSHRFTAPENGGNGGGSVMARAGRMLRRLHYDGHLRYAYMRFQKPHA